MPKLSGDSSISIRKGKSIVLFEYTIEAEWAATQGSTTAKGLFLVNEFDQNDIDDLEISIDFKESPEDLKKHRSFMLSTFKKTFEAALVLFFKEFKELETNQGKLAESERQRREEELKLEEALRTQGEIHNELLAHARSQEELQRKIVFEESAKDSNFIQGKGSEWNVNSYFWEEKTVAWATPKLIELLKAVEIPVPAGELKITAADADGDSSINIRKGRKIVIFNYELTLSFEGKLFDNENNEISSASGKIQIPDFSTDAGPDYEMYITISESVPGHERLLEPLRTNGKAAIYGALAEFVVLLTGS